MKRFLFLIVLASVGCTNNNTASKQYKGSVTTQVENGNTIGMKVRFPNSDFESSVNNIEEADRIIAQTDALLKAMQEARKQMLEAEAGRKNATP
jgi:hypothetical protein